MTTGAGQAGKAMEALGLSAFNSDGSFKGLGQIFKDLNGKLKGMTDEQKNYYLAMIGGKTQVDALQKILDGVGNEYDELKNKIKDSEGALKTMSDVMNDNSKGGIAQLKSALEEAGIAIYTTLKPAIAFLTEKIQGVVNWFNGLDEGAKGVITTFGIVVFAIGGVLVALGALLPGIVSAIFLFGSLGSMCTVIGGLIAFLTSPIGMVASALGFLTWAWETNFLGMRDSAKILADKVKSAFNGIKNVFASVKEKCKEFGESIKATWQSIKEFLKHPIRGTIQLVKNGVSNGGASSKTSKSKKGKRSAFGTARVVGNDVPFRLHDGEKILTKGEAKRYEKGQAYKGVSITVNGLTVREDADIDKIASKLVKKLNQNKIILGGV